MPGFLTGARRGLDRAVHRSWRASLSDLEAAGGDAGRVIAWGRTEDGGHCIVATGVLSISTGDAATEQVWRHVGWHRIEHGGFDADTATLRWTEYDGEPESVRLTEPGRVPQLFRERVAASIAVEQFLPMEPDSTKKGVIINGRRDLTRPDGPLHWHASLPKSMTWQVPGIAEFADAAIARMRREYDPES